MSRALPAGYYRDPAEVVEIKQLTELGCRACESHTIAWGKVMCTDARKTNNKGVPNIGRRCQFFNLKR